MQGALARLGSESVEMGELGAADDLDPVRMDEIEMADQALARIAQVFVIEFASAAIAAGDPVEAQFLAVVGKELCGADFRHWVAIR